jgi:phenylalanyl-tRNA synthetase beta chain
MKFSYDWLKELSESKLSAEKMAELLTMKAFEVEKESRKNVISIPEKVIIGKILEIKKHPNADKLQLVKVDIGKNILNIVCGAWNIKIGDMVPVALPGAKLPGGMEIREAEIRGKRSCGMLCADDELALGEDHSGIMILPGDAPIGYSLSEYYKADSNDTLDIKVLPDRAHDAMSHAFMAREIAAIEGRNSDYDFDGLILPRKKGRKLDIKIENARDCRRYIGILIEGVKIAPSPKWLVRRLESCGVRSINNVVDITNYIMLELGSPIHAFDVKRINKGKNSDEHYPVIIRTRRAKPDEEIKLLDESVIKLSPDDIVISGKNSPLALAGIMGGEDSGIYEDTSDIILEFANFDPIMIRKSRMRLGLKTEASDRFEKDLDPNLAEKAAVRTTEMIMHLAGGTLSEIADIYPRKTKPWKIMLGQAYLEKLLGEKIPASKIKKFLDSLGIEVKTEKKQKGAFACVIPTERKDLKTAEDLIEEIGRIWGYEHIASQTIGCDSKPPKTDEYFHLNRKLRNIMVSMGFDEEYNHAFYSQKDANNLGISASHVEIANPVSPELNLFCASLLPNLVRNAAMNAGNFEEMKIFELGKVYCFEGGMAREKHRLGILIASPGRNSIRNFQTAKGAIDNLILSLGGPANANWKKKDREITFIIDGTVAGIIKKLNSKTLLNFHIKRYAGEIYVAEIDVRLLLNVFSRNITFTPLAKFPSSVRDISFRMPQGKKKNCAEIEKIIRKSAGKDLTMLEIFDVYEKEGEISYAWRMHFGGTNRTLRGEEVDSIMERVASAIEKEGFQIRK